MRLLPLAFCACAMNWGTRDTALEIATAGTLAVDTIQTINAQSSGFEETNPVLGKHPPATVVLVYFAIAIGVHALISNALPPPLRLVWQGSWIIGESFQVGENHARGIWP